MRQIIAGIILSLVAAVSSAAPISGQGNWETTLQGRLPLTPGGSDYQAYYDTELNVTWLADANLSKTSGYDADGFMTGSESQTWIGTLNAASYLGVNNWRLPTVTDTGPLGCDFAFTGTDCGYNVDLSTGEMARMYYGALGDTGGYNTSGAPQPCNSPILNCLTNTGPFANLQTDRYYWTGTEWAPPYTSTAWYFDFYDGAQVDQDKSHSNHAWAVRPGDLAAVPVPTVAWLIAPAFGLLAPWVKRKHLVAWLPAAAWLLGSALGVLGVMRRRVH
jgi:hypothetical protein